MPRPVVSVIIPVRGDIGPLLYCLKALAKQTYPKSSFEVIVIDNGIDGGNATIADILPNLVVDREAVIGCYRARNRGLAKATGEIIAFTDADCVPQPDWIAAGVAALLEQGTETIIGGRIISIPVPGKRPSVVDLYQDLFAFPQKESIKYIKVSVTANLFTFKQVFSLVGQFDDRLLSGGDYEWGDRCNKAGILTYYREDVVVHHWNRTSLTELINKALRVSSTVPPKHRRSRKVVWDLLRENRLSNFGHGVLVLGLLVVIRTLSLLEAVRLKCGGKQRNLDKCWGYCHLPKRK